MRPTAEIQFHQDIPAAFIAEIESALKPRYEVAHRAIAARADHFDAADILDIIVYIDEHRTEWIADNIVGPAAFAAATMVARGVCKAVIKLGGSMIQKLSGGKRKESSCMIKYRYRDIEFDVTVKGIVPAESVERLVSQLMDTMVSSGKKAWEQRHEKSGAQRKHRIRVTYNPVAKGFVRADQEALRQAAEQNRTELRKKLNDLSA